MEWVRDLFLARVFGFPGSVTDDGGAECAGQMTTAYRVGVALVSVSVHYLLYLCFSRPYVEKQLAKLPEQERKPSRIERFFGVLVLVSWILQVIYKVLTKRLINMLNPCHTVTLLEGYLLLTPWSPRTERAFLCFLSWHFGS